MSYVLYIFLAFAPSVVWLLFYLDKDRHPEAKGMLFKIFLYGAMIALPAALAESVFEKQLYSLVLPSRLYSLIYFFVIVGFIEEFVKYLAADLGAFTSSELDEPMDIIIYMIVAALGFAALENSLYLWPTLYGFAAKNNLAILLATERFVGATFLHTLTSGSLGYFLALSYHDQKRRAIFFVLGFLVAIGLHGLFNFSIIEVEGFWQLGIPGAILIGLALFLSWAIRQAKKMPSVCKI